MSAAAPRAPDAESSGAGLALPPEARAAVLAWYDEHGRALAFRTTRDPYAILVSEVMAQQTQISRVVEAWRRFLARFPTVASLAGATPADVVRAWQGMGYDRRALNLRRAAQAMVELHGGRVPRSIADLERLPGVGPYTARAVAAIAFGMAVAAVDTNVRRVIARSVGGRAADAWSARQLQAVADSSVDPGRPADWTHATMDIGATFCRPRAPRCEACPLAAWCRFARDPEPGGADVRSFRGKPAAPEFRSTTRWLRGRIVDRLRAAAAGSWTAIDAPIGDHDEEAVVAAIAALARDGLLQVDPDDRRTARLALD